METTNNQLPDDLADRFADLAATAYRAEAAIGRITDSWDATIRAINRHTEMKTAPIINAAEQSADKLEETLKQYARQRLVLAALETDLAAAIEQLRKVSKTAKPKPATQDEHH